MMMSSGCEVHDVALDLSAADHVFETLRALAFARAFGPTLDSTSPDGQGDDRVER